jgi:hypothetical protein
LTAKRVRLALTYLPSVVLLFLVLVVGCSRPPSEAKLVKSFDDHRALHERLREMILQDQKVRAVYVQSGVETTDSGLPKPPSEVNFPADRYDAYVGLLRQIGSTEIFRRGDASGGEICNSMWASGFGGDTRHVHICWLEDKPANVVSSLKDFYQSPKPRHPVFRHIDGNWYIWADW